VGFVTDHAMRRTVSLGFGLRSPLSALLSGLLALACSAPSASREPEDVEISAAAGRAGSASAGMGGALSSAAGRAGATGGTFTSAGTATSTAGVAGKAGAGSGGLSGSGTGGATTGGVATGDGGGGSASGGGSGASAVCEGVNAEYASELEKQLACNPNAGSQCANKVAAAPGCECRVFMQPSDPFAIEHLSNVANGWFDADCSMPTCPARCSTAATGTCQADSKSPLGGRCVSP
jgi:hypothetical protein